MTFVEQLKQWRTAQGMSQADLDQALGKRGLIGQIESGRLKPPTRDVCIQIADALGLDRDDVWDTAAPERMAGYDPELLEWHRGELERVSGADVFALEEARRHASEEVAQLRQQLLDERAAHRAEVASLEAQIRRARAVLGGALNRGPSDPTSGPIATTKE